MGLVRELADLTGLSAQVTAVLADTYKGAWTYAPGAVFADLAAAAADWADCIDGVGQLCGDREHVFGAKASITTMWRLVDSRIDAAHLPKVLDARDATRAAARAAGAAPPAGAPLYFDIEAALVIDHSDNKQEAAPTKKKSFGHHPLLAFLGRPEIAGGRALAGLLRKGNAGSNTAADQRRWPRYRPSGAPTRRTRTHPWWWRAAIRLGPPISSPRPAGIAGSGSPSDFPWTPASGTPWTPCTSPMAGTRRSTLAARSVTGHGWPRPPVWSTSRPGPPGPDSFCARSAPPRSPAALH